MKKLVFASVLLLFNSVHAELTSLASQTTESLVQKSLLFIEGDQHQIDNQLYWTGEWPVQMRSYLAPALLGVGKLWAKPTEESTSFATASIMNLLAETYVLNPRYKNIESMLKKGLASIDNYVDGSVFNFYNWIDYNGSAVRGPKAAGYVPAYIQGLTNIPADADTTSATYLSKAYYELIAYKKTMNSFQVPVEALDTFSRYRDVNRKPHYYNYLESIKNSGAFMTWFLDEKHMPKSLIAKPDRGARIPFGFNDVDCVVNGNILRLLTETNNKSQQGYDKSCEVLNFVINKGKQAQCGIYYPNSYAVFFSISNAYKAGALCLENSKDKAIDFITSNQNPDGSWDNEPGIGRTDKVQSTALALNALLNYSQVARTRFPGTIRSAVQFLKSQARTNPDGLVYWPGEVFFAAVAQARNTVLWRSKSYTTALVVLTLVKAEKEMQEPL